MSRELHNPSNLDDLQHDEYLDQSLIDEESSEFYDGLILSGIFDNSFDSQARDVED